MHRTPVRASRDDHGGPNTRERQRTRTGEQPAATSLTSSPARGRARERATMRRAVSQCRDYLSTASPKLSTDACLPELQTFQFR
ncbi:hypothetical protein Taro_015958 [Colocasia esculenta]|uniref:Uncharacterized protein n=1 Tax=Colocasia esculenta TaxID=4460 RepID=A0A843UMK9_COLES|nr:hypothetical protein [Colocasia esculenta]